MANPIEGIPTGAKLVAWGIIAAVGIVLLFILWPITMIGGTEAGIVLRNKAIHHTLPPDTGLALRVPLIDQVVKADLTIQTFKMTAPVYSKDSQIVDTTVTVNYKVDPGQVEQAYRETQLNYEAKLISPNMPDVLESSLSAFTANDLVELRPTLGGKVKSALIAKLVDRPYLVIDTVSVELNFDDQYEAAVKRKQVEAQNALAEANITASQEQKKQQEIKKAEALAEKTRLESQALASQQGEKLISKIYAEAFLKLAEKWTGDVPETYIVNGQSQNTGSASGLPAFMTFFNVNPATK